MTVAIYACYGMPKSGSTLAHQLSIAILEEAGIPQPRLSQGIISGSRTDNFLHVFRPAHINAAVAEITQPSHPRPIAIRTQGGVWAATAEAIAKGTIAGLALARDPRDVALSLLDAARTGAPWGQRNDKPLDTVAGAIELVRSHIEKFHQWQRQPGFIALNYEELAFDTEKTVGKIADQLGVTVDANRVIEKTGNRFTQLNKGISQRWREEMPSDEANRYYEEFAEFIEMYCLPPGLPGRV